VLERALEEQRQVRSSAGSEVQSLDTSLAALKSIDERIAEIRQAVWSED
jgi:hypothetical protein